MANLRSTHVAGDLSVSGNLKANLSIKIAGVTKTLDGSRILEWTADDLALLPATATTAGVVKLGSATVQTTAANAVSTTASRSYAVQVDSSGKMVVNVPWVDANTIYTHPTGDGDKHVPATGTTNNGKFLMAGATAGSLSWANIPTATADADGVVKLGSNTKITAAVNAPSTTASRNYPIQLDSNGRMAVNVPWVDNNTVYTHPTGDGNLHVPATGTTNNGKFLMAGSTLGSLSWSALPAASETASGTVEKSTDAEALAGTANKFPDAKQVHATFNQFGVGKNKDLRNSLFETGVPSDTTSSGVRFGLANMGPSGLKIPGFADNVHGALLVGNHWNFQDDVSSAHRVCISGGDLFSQGGAIGNVWGPWKQYHHTDNGATNAEAEVGINTKKWISPAGVHAAFKQYGYGKENPNNLALNCNNLPAGSRNSWSDGITESIAVSLNLPALGGNSSSPRSWHVECYGRGTTRLVQEATEVFGQGTPRGRKFIRIKHDAAWYPWQEVITTNTSGTLGIDISGSAAKLNTAGYVVEYNPTTKSLDFNFVG